MEINDRLHRIWSSIHVGATDQLILTQSDSMKGILQGRSYFWPTMYLPYSIRIFTTCTDTPYSIGGCGETTCMVSVAAVRGMHMALVALCSRAVLAVLIVRGMAVLAVPSKCAW